MAFFKRLEGSRLAVPGLIVVAILFVAVNVFANAQFRGVQLDVTEDRLFTLSDSTRKVLQALEEPITLRLYFSPSLGEAAPRYANYHARVQELLNRYVELSGGKLRLERLDPEPFSDAEDRAVADGLQGVPVNTAGDLGFFGLVGANSTDGREVIPFFNLEREPFLEYDLTKLVYGLAHPNRPVLGLLSAPNALGGFAGPGGGGPELLIVDQLREFFEVETLDSSLEAVPERIGVLMVIDPGSLSDRALYAIDQFVLRGGRALVFADPNLESAAAGGFGMPTAKRSDVNRLFKAWGAELVDGKVAGDLDAARRVSTGAAGGNVVGDYVAWLTLGPNNFDESDPVLANIERMNLATSGILQPVKDAATNVAPLIRTGSRSMAIDVDRVRMMPDVLGLLRSFQPKGEPLTLAARITGDVATAFPEGPPPQAEKPSDAKDADEGDATESKPGAGSESTPAPALLAKSVKPINVLVVADADMLYDRFWVNRTDFFGQRVNIPTANNGDFVTNALENLSDSEALIGLRGRGISNRPFVLVEELRRSAELLYRAKEQALQEKLKELQGQLNTISSRTGGEGGGEALLTAEDKAALERFRAEMLDVRKQLRDVQLALRQDIEALERFVKFVNIAAVPLLLAIVAIVVAVARRLKRRRSARAALATA